MLTMRRADKTIGAVDACFWLPGHGIIAPTTMPLRHVEDALGKILKKSAARCLLIEATMPEVINLLYAAMAVNDSVPGEASYLGHDALLRGIAIDCRMINLLTSLMLKGSI